MVTLPQHQEFHPQELEVNRSILLSGCDFVDVGAISSLLLLVDLKNIFISAVLRIVKMYLLICFPFLIQKFIF